MLLCSVQDQTQDFNKRQCVPFMCTQCGFTYKCICSNWQSYGKFVVFCSREQPLCDLSKVMTKGSNKLWQHPTTPIQLILLIATVFKVSVAVWKYYAYICIFYTIPHIGVILRTSDDNPLESDFNTVRSFYAEHSAYTITVQCS